MEAATPASATSTQTTTTLGDASAALAMADSSLATPTTEATPASTTEAAPIAPTQETPEAAESVSTEAQGAKGEPPKWRWQDILANARETTKAETEARVRQEIEQRYQWAKDVAEHERAGLLVWRAAMQGDPQALASIKANPQAVQWLKGLVTEPQAAAPDPEPEPDVELPLRDAQGTIVGTRTLYSSEQQAKREAWMERQLMAKFEKRLEPLQQTAQTFQQREQQATYTTQVTQVLAQMKAADPTFEGRLKDVASVLQGDAQLLTLALGTEHTPPNVALALELADARVYRTKVVPTQHAQTEADMLAKLKRDAVNGTLNPGAATPTTPKPTLGDARAALAHASTVLGG